MFDHYKTGNMRLLLVEDDVMIGETVLDVLRAEHFAVDWVKDGAMADTAVRSQHYDLILLDLGLPKRGGLDVLKGLRQPKDATLVERIAPYYPQGRTGI